MSIFKDNSDLQFDSQPIGADSGLGSGLIDQQQQDHHTLNNNQKLMNADPNQLKELEDLKRKFFLLDQERKNHYQSTQQKR